MNVIQNVKTYIDLFASSNKSLASYLSENNINIIDFLKEIGLNPALVQTYNYKELESLASLLLDSSNPPVLSTQLYGVSFSENTVAIDVGNIQILLNENKIAFNIEYNENGINTIESIMFILDRDKICKKTVIMSDLKGNELDGDRLKAYVNETIYQASGEVENENSYEMLINYTRAKSVKNTLIRALSADSSKVAPATIVKLLDNGILKREEVDIKYNGLQKNKVS